MAKEKVRTYFDTGKEKLIFDAIFTTQYEHTLNITSHPIQSGADITDHAYKEADELTFDIGMSDVMKSIVPGQFAGTNSRSVSAYKKIKELQEQRLPIKVITRLGSYSNMMIQNISVLDDNTTTYGLRATVTLKQIFVVSVATVKISARAQKTDSTNNGNQKAQKADESFLHSLFR